jgi:dTDP-4-dehydrorhamnose reductase
MNPQHHKTLILGGKGMLGQDVSRVFPSSISLSRQECNITVPLDISQKIEAHTPSLIINCAAYTKVDLAETEKEKAHSINAIGAKNVALACTKYDIPLIHISTDYVFDGTSLLPYQENDACNPISAYGMSKRKGEEYILLLAPRAKIIRTQWLYGHGGSNFVETILRLAQSRNTLSIIHDQYGSPTNTKDLAQAIRTISSFSQAGIFHIHNSGFTSWADFAAAIFEGSKLKCVVEPMSADQYPLPVKRPPNGRLAMSRWEQELDLPLLPHWKESLQQYLQERSTQK